MLFAVALIDASIIGACAVSLSTAYAIGVLVVGSALTVTLAVAVKGYEKWRGLTVAEEAPLEHGPRQSWRMPPLVSLAPAKLTLLSKTWMLCLRGYLVIAAGLLLIKLFQLALSAS